MARRFCRSIAFSKYFFKSPYKLDSFQDYLLEIFVYIQIETPFIKSLFDKFGFNNLNTNTNPHTHTHTMSITSRVQWWQLTVTNNQYYRSASVDLTGITTGHRRQLCSIRF